MSCKAIAQRTEHGSNPGELLLGHRSTPPNLDAAASVASLTLWKRKDSVTHIVYNFTRHKKRVQCFNTHPCTTTFCPCSPAKNIHLPNKAVGGRTPCPPPIAINPMWCRTVLISLKVMKIVQIASKEVSRSGRARSPVTFAGVLHRAWQWILRRHRDQRSTIAQKQFFGVFVDAACRQYLGANRFFWAVACLNRLGVTVPYQSFGDTIPVPTVARIHFLASKLWYKILPALVAILFC